jgi:hypothetical protein
MCIRDRMNVGLGSGGAQGLTKELGNMDARVIMEKLSTLIE